MHELARPNTDTEPVTPDDGVRVVPVPEDLRIPDILAGIAVPLGPLYEVQARMDALAARMHGLGLTGIHWMNKGYGHGCFSLEEVEGHVDELALLFAEREGRIIDVTTQHVSDPLCIESRRIG